MDMANKAKKPFRGLHSVTPYLVCQGAAKAIAWYQKVFGAEEISRMPGPDGVVYHAEIRFGDSLMMLADEFPEMGARSPKSIGGTPVGFNLYVQDVDAVFAQAIAAGATVERPLQDQFYGDRSGSLLDPFGHKWTVATHIEDLTHEEMVEREKEWSAKQQKG
jgi:PhnB protein